MAKSRNKEAYDRNPALYVIAAFVFVILLMFARHHPSQRTSSTSVVKGVKGSKQGIQDEIGNARKEDNVFARVKTFNSAASELQAVLKSYWNNGTALDKSFCFENLNAEGMEFIGKKIARAIKYQRPLIVAVIGSSVNHRCFHDALLHGGVRLIQLKSWYMLFWMCIHAAIQFRLLQDMIIVSMIPWNPSYNAPSHLFSNLSAFHLRYE